MLVTVSYKISGLGTFWFSQNKKNCISNGGRAVHNTKTACCLSYIKLGYVAEDTCIHANSSDITSSECVYEQRKEETASASKCLICPGYSIRKFRPD